MEIDVVAIFPEIITGYLGHGLLKKALEKRALSVNPRNLRDYTEDKHRVVDDVPFGGGPGMVLKCEPLFSAVGALKKPGSLVILLSPQGKLLSQEMLKRHSGYGHVIMLCGRYEGMDERVSDNLADEEISIGDYVLSGGEIAACVYIDALARLIPGVVGDGDSVTQDSFYAGLLKHPQYTRPADHEGRRVPEVLLSGNHADIARWRREKSLERTFRKRPELLERAELSAEDRKFLQTLGHRSKEVN